MHDTGDEPHEAESDIHAHLTRVARLQTDFPGRKGVRGALAIQMRRTHTLRATAMGGQKTVKKAIPTRLPFVSTPYAYEGCQGRGGSPLPGGVTSTGGGHLYR